MLILQQPGDNFNYINDNEQHEYILIDDHECDEMGQTRCETTFNVKALAKKNIKLTNELVNFIISKITPANKHYTFLTTVYNNKTNIKDSIKTYIKNLHICGPNLNPNNETDLPDEDYVFYLINLPYN
jgi:hypothetical protein